MNPEHRALKAIYAELTETAIALVVKEPQRPEFAQIAALLDRLHDEVLVPLDEKLAPSCDGGHSGSAGQVGRV